MWKKAVTITMSSARSCIVRSSISDADAAGHLREILPRDAHPLDPVLHQETATARVAAEFFAETLR
ncbi:MAG: hypothetical protein IPL06_18545 [Betaproteobacteria bacterium]|nr:hypothetical protein [Betaproteobacteria bacterium]